MRCIVAVRHAPLRMRHFFASLLFLSSLLLFPGPLRVSLRDALSSGTPPGLGAGRDSDSRSGSTKQGAALPRQYKRAGTS